MRRPFLSLMALAALALVPARARGGVVVGEAAPDFTLQDSKGAKHALSSYKGKLVVLEWVNYECPFVKRHYDTGNMQRLQRTYTGKGLVWLSVNSSAPGKQGHFAPDVVEAMLKERKAAASAYLLDSDGTVGRAYGAKTTPHMFVIDASGELIYAGGIDDKPSTDSTDVPGPKSYVQAALDEALAGKTVSTPTSTPYGCSVKY